MWREEKVNKSVHGWRGWSSEPVRRKRNVASGYTICFFCFVLFFFCKHTDKDKFSTWESNLPALCRNVMQISCSPRISQELFSKHSNTPQPTSPALTRQCWISAGEREQVRGGTLSSVRSRERRQIVCRATRCQWRLRGGLRGTTPLWRTIAARITNLMWRVTVSTDTGGRRRRVEGREEKRVGGGCSGGWRGVGES